MTTATVRAYLDNGVGPTSTSVDGGTATFGLDDAQNATTPIAVPASAAGTDYSWIKYLYLNVTVAATTSTSLLNRKVYQSALVTGLTYFFFTGGQSTYTQANGTSGTAAGNKPVDSATTNGVVPTNYTAVTTSAQAYDSATGSSTATGRNGKYCQMCCGVDKTYAAGGGTSAGVTLTLQYDEQLVGDVFAGDSLTAESAAYRLDVKRANRLPFGMARGALFS